MNSVKETLIAARKLIEKPENWAQGAYARDAKGVDLSSKGAKKGNEAVSFCMYGALMRVNGPFELRAAELLRDAADVLFNARAITWTNDQHSHEEVLRWIDTAIERAGE